MGLVRWLLWVLCAFLGKWTIAEEECGGLLTERAGLLQTPNFPKPFQVPLKCRWIIDSLIEQQKQPVSIVVYFTQLYVTSGLTFTEYAYYEPDSSFQLEPKLVFAVSEDNAITTEWVYTRNQYFVIEFTMDRLEGNHVRVLDDLLDVYGFNITYEMVPDFESETPVRNSSCNLLGCSLAGNCFVTQDYTKFWCDCFPGFSAENCMQGPLCQDDTNVCLNGATCRHVGMLATCYCSADFTGSRCEVPILRNDCKDELECTSQCRYDGRIENACKCDHTSGRISQDRWRYEMKVRVANMSALSIQHPGQTLFNFLERQIARYFRSFSLRKFEDLRILNITENGNVTFHFFGSVMDASKVRDVGNKLLERAKLGEISLLPSEGIFYQEPGLNLNEITGDQIIREGHQLVMSCIAQGSAHMSFRWLKDGDPINVSKSAGIMWTKLIPKTDHQQYTAVLGIEKVDALDEGHYTCQIFDWGLQECKSIYVEVVQAPQVQVLPMSASLQKGESINLKCVSPNEGRWSDQDQIGYSWARDKKLFPLNPGQEVWEDLKPSGSILRVQNIQKSTTYTCKAHTSAATREQSVRIDVINHTSVAMCKEEIKYGTKWSIASPGSTALSECPFKYLGVARRQCLIDQPGVAFWQNPDFSNCISEKFDKIIRDFRILARGFVKTSIERTLSELVLFLEEQGELYPGEGEPIVELLQDVLNYINRTLSWNDLIDSTIYLYKTINLLLMYNESIIDENKLKDLQILVNRWSLLFGEHMNGTMSHFSFDTFVIDIMKVIDINHNSYYIPTLSNSYPLWYNVRIAVHVSNEDQEDNLYATNRIAVINYRNISKFLPVASTQKMSDGSEVTYEIQSNIISVAIAGQLTIRLDVELHLRKVKDGWNITCANAPSFGSSWDMSSCRYSVKKYNITHCICRFPGVYTALITKHSSMNADGIYKNLRLASVVVIGCTCCLIQSLLALILLLIRWWYRKTCILFLKLQCCTSVTAIMSIFIYTSRCTLPQSSFTYITVLMEALMLLGISTHLSKLLVVYTEVVRLPNVQNIKKTVFGITTGATLLTVLCSLLAHKISGNSLKSWWLPYDSAIFFIATTCGILIIVMFIFLFCNLLRRLKFLLCVQDAKTNHIITRRIGLLKRTAILFTSVVSVAVSSILYVNSYSKLYHYLFSVLCALLGFVIFLCYVLHSESSLNLHLLTHLKLQKAKDQEFSSESDNNLFNFFTKQEAEVESDCAPPCIKSTPTKLISELTPMNEKLIIKPKMVTFNGEDVICEKKEVEDVDLEIYPNSPKKYKCINLGIKPSSKDALNEENVALNPQIQETAFNLENIYPVRDVPDVLTTRACVEIDLELPNLIVTNETINLPPAGISSTATVVPSVETASVIAPHCTEVSNSDIQMMVMAEGEEEEEEEEEEEDESSSYIEMKQSEDPLLNPPQLNEVLPTIMEVEDGEDKDVLDRITHDLDYLLNRRPDNEVLTYQRHKKQPTSDTSKSIPSSSFVAKTTL